MNRISGVAAFAMLLTIGVVACGGGGGSSAPGGTSGVGPVNPAPPAGGVPQVTATGGLATLSLTIPNTASASSTTRRPAYISAATKSVAVFAYPSAATPPPTATTLVNVGAGQPGCAAVATGTTCTITVPAVYGSMTFVVKTFDNVLGTGNLLSQATLTQTIGPNQSTIPVTLSGVVAATKITVPAFSFPAGGGTFTLTVNALDPNGATIVGSGSYNVPIGLTASDAGVTFSPNVVTGPGQPVTVTYGAGVSSAVTIRAGAAGVSEAQSGAVDVTFSQPASSDLTAFVFDSFTGVAYAFNAGANGAPGFEGRYPLANIASYGVSLATNGSILAVLPAYAPTVALINVPSGTRSALSVSTYGATGLAYDNSTGSPTSGDLAALTTYPTPEIAYYAPTATGGAAPVATLANASLGTANAIAIDGSGNVYAYSYIPPSQVVEFAAGSSTPTATIPLSLPANVYALSGGFTVAADGTIAVTVVDTTTTIPQTSVRIYGPRGTWSLQRTLGGGPIAASFGGALAFAPDDTLYFANGSGVAVYAPTATGTAPPERGFRTTLANASNIDAIALGAPYAEPTPAAASISGDMLGLAANRTWTYRGTALNGTTVTVTMYQDPQPVDGNTGLVAFAIPGAMTDALPAEGGTLVGAVGVSSGSDGYHAQSFGSVSNDSFGLVPGAPLIVSSTLTSGATFIPYPGVTATVRSIGNVPGATGCPPTVGTTGAVVYYVIGTLTEQFSFVPGCGITRFINEAGTVFVLQAVGSHPEVGQQSVVRHVLHATYGDTLRALWQAVLVRH